MEKLVLHIALPVPLFQQFDYLTPQDFPRDKLQTGVRIQVPWRGKHLVGILLGTSANSRVAAAKLKYAIALLDNVPLLTKTILALLNFAADYYHHPVGEVYAAALPALLRQGRAAEYRPHESPFEALPETMPLLALTAAQQAAVQNITQALGKFQPFLLFGVTGSGKTEVYLQVIAQVLAQGKQALVLVPEIGLTPQTVGRFQQRFPVTIAVLHSGLTDRERQTAWLQASNGDALVVIGTRSAIFTPLLNPGVIILDEEHDMSFKQQDGFRYSARDLAIVRGQLEQIPVVLGSATPALESLHNALTSRYQLLTLPERAGCAVHPEIRMIDLRQQPPEHGLSQPLLSLMQQHLQHGQVLLFLNRRGYAPTVMCHQCGWVAQCRRCDARLTLHQQPAHLQCHHCGSQRSLDKTCPECGAEQLFPLGAGTERIEQALLIHFPEIPVIRIDRDTTRRKGALEDKLAIIHQGEPGILLGTQMLAKGHHFPAVTLAGIINADAGLFSADFRGTERTAQLLLQVAGRAGRADRPGEVVIQTYHPEHALLKLLLAEGYAAFAKAALQERELAGLPPYHVLALLRAEAIQVDMAVQFLHEVRILLAPDAEVTILGPIPAPMPKRAGKHRAHLLIQAKGRKALKQFLVHLVEQITALKSKQRVRWSIDVDPIEMF